MVKKNTMASKSRAKAPAKKKAAAKAPAKKKAAAKAPAKKKASAKKKAASQERAVVAKKTTAVSTDVLEFLEEDAGLGLDFGSQDVKRTVIKLLQQLSPELDSGDERYVENAEVGDFYISGKGELYEQLDVIPIGFMHNFVEWHPRKEGGGLVGVHDFDPSVVQGLPRDGAIWITDEGTEIHDTMTYYVFYKDENDEWQPATLFMKSTNLSVGRRLNTELKNQRVQNKSGKLVPVPIFMNIVTLGKVEDRNEQGRWFKLSIEEINLIDDADLYQAAKVEFELFRKNFSDRVDFESSGTAKAVVVDDEEEELDEEFDEEVEDEELEDEELEEEEEDEEMY